MAQTSGPLDEVGAPPTLFDTFPDATMDCILRQFSRLPAAKDWEPHLPLEEISELYKVSGAMGIFMLGRFHTLVVSFTFDATTENILFHWNIGKVGVLWTNDIDAARAFVRAGCGKTLSGLVIGATRFEEDPPVEYIDDFVRGCPCVKFLNVADHHGLWEDKYEHTLDTVGVITETPPKWKWVLFGAPLGHPLKY